MNNVQMWLSEPLALDVRRAIERLARSDDVVRVAVMPDVHLAEEVCVGTVVATTRLIYPNAVGGDIGCGMAAVRVNAERDALDRADAAERILSALDLRVPIMSHHAHVTLPAELLEGADRSAAKQLGTLGRGNHFLELQCDEENNVWICVHTGSRGMGQAIRDRALARCKTSRAGLAYLDDATDYLRAMSWALAFARASRTRILEAAVDVIGADVVAGSRIECHHNFVERVNDVWVHRKGAIRANEGDVAIIPGSMGSTTYHVQGRGNADALWSASHGAGRTMSRSDARRRITVADLQRETRGVWLDRSRLRLLVDEAPSAYKDISKVMRAQRDLVRIVRRLTPLLTYKG